MKTVYILISMFWGIYTSYSQTPQNYTSFQGTSLSLYAWQGNKIMLLSSSNTLNTTTMTNWVNAMDGAYNYYALCTGREPYFYTGVTYLNNRSTIADVPATCGAGCGYVGWTGIEMPNSTFTNMYNSINNQNLYNQVPFYELGRNFWFYDSQLKYKSNDPIVTGYAVFMRFMSMEAAGVQGAPFNSWSFTQFKNNVINLLPAYMADNSLNWGNTLGIGQGVPNSNLGATDLFASFCFYLRDNYCGQNWLQNVWKFAGLRPTALTTQDAVDNFIIAASQAANTNLVALFSYWRWTVSANAIAYINSLNLGSINTQPTNQTGNAGDNLLFTVTTSDCNAIYQWQIDSGLGYQNINNTGQYSGAASNTLTVSNITGANNGQLFRCIVASCSWADTSTVAILTVTTGINDLTNENSFVIYPNPSNGKFNLVIATRNEVKEKQSQIEIYNMLGECIYKSLILNPQSLIDISAQPSGMYFYQIKNEQQLIGNGKIVIQ